MDISREFMNANPRAFFSVVETPIGYIDGLSIQAPGTNGSVTWVSWIDCTHRKGKRGSRWSPSAPKGSAG